MQFNRNDIKLSFEKPIYSVNKEKGKVACVLRYHINFPCGSEVKNTGVFFGNDPWMSESKAVGVAACGPNDKFDEKTGMQIAEARAESVAYSAANKKIEKLFQNLAEQMYNWQSAFDTKAGGVVKHNREFIQEIG